MTSTSTIPEEEGDDNDNDNEIVATTANPQEKEGTTSLAYRAPTPELVDNNNNNNNNKDHRPTPLPSLNGTFKVVENHNFGDFLKAQGVPWFLCNAASKARPTHTFSLVSYSELTIQIKGIIESETSYSIDGPHTETQIRGRVFRDTVRYLYENDPEEREGEGEGEGEDKKENEETNTAVGLQTTKVSVSEGYVVHVTRRLVLAGTTFVPPTGFEDHGYDLDVPSDIDRLWMGNRMVRGKSGSKSDSDSDSEPVLASQLFRRVQ